MLKRGVVGLFFVRRMRFVGGLIRVRGMLIRRYVPVDEMGGDEAVMADEM